jgi:hypothetical protein
LVTHCAGLALALVSLLLAPGVASACANEGLRAELHSMALPDCRAYELVSPPKDGLTVNVRGGSSEDSIVAVSLASFSGSTQAVFNYYEFLRGVDGWETTPLNTPAGYTNLVASNFLAASPDLREGLFEYGRSAAVDPRERAYYISALPDSPPVEVGPVFSHAALSLESNKLPPNLSVASASKNLTHILFMIEGPSRITGSLIDYVWPGDTTASTSGQGFSSLYEYTGTGKTAPALVGVSEGGHLIGECGTSLGYPSGGSFTSLQGGEIYNAISADGLHTFFTVARECEVGTGPPANELFARVGGSKTVPLSEPSTGPEGDCSECHTSEPADAVFQGASEDGSKVFYLSQQHLLGGSAGTNLYEYDFNAEKGNRVALIAPHVAGVSRVSEDGSHVYFVATDVLTNAPNPVGKVAQNEADNLYVYESDASNPEGHIAFVGTLAPSDGADWSQEDLRPVDATPDGRYLVFTSSAGLTPDDTSPLPQVFEYDAQAETLVRISRTMEGAGDVGGSDFESVIAYSNYTGNDSPAPQPSSVSNDGEFVVFATSAALTPQAVEGYPNIYEYHAGRLSLISDGQDRSVLQGGSPTTRLVGISGSGASIFFTTGDQLVPQDGDTQEDIYAATAEGGFLPPGPSSCKSEGCQGQLAPPPLFAVAGSVGQSAGEQVIESPKPVAKVKGKPKAKSKRKTRKPRKAGKFAKKGGRKTNRSASGSKRR